MWRRRGTKRVRCFFLRSFRLRRRRRRRLITILYCRRFRISVSRGFSTRLRSDCTATSKERAQIKCRFMCFNFDDNTFPFERVIITVGCVKRGCWYTVYVKRKRNL